MNPYPNGRRPVRQVGDVQHVWCSACKRFHPRDHFHPWKNARSKIKLLSECKVAINARNIARLRRKRDGKFVDMRVKMGWGI